MAVAWQLKNIKEGSVFDEKHSKTRARVDAEKLYLLDVKQARQLMGDELVGAGALARGRVARRCHVGAGLGRVKTIRRCAVSRRS